MRLPADQSIASLTPLELLDTYWKSVHTQPVEMDTLHTLAASIIQTIAGDPQGEMTEE